MPLRGHRDEYNAANLNCIVNLVGKFNITSPSVSHRTLCSIEISVFLNFLVIQSIPTNLS